jgi:hypothetical protein
MTAPHLDRTRAAYDTVAVDYARLLEVGAGGRPADRAVLGRFAADVTGEVAPCSCHTEPAAKCTTQLRDMGPGLPASRVKRPLIDPGRAATWSGAGVPRTDRKGAERGALTGRA